MRTDTFDLFAKHNFLAQKRLSCLKTGLGPLVIQPVCLNMNSNATYVTYYTNYLYKLFIIRTRNSIIVCICKIQNDTGEILLIRKISLWVNKLVKVKNFMEVLKISTIPFRG